MSKGGGDYESIYKELDKLEVLYGAPVKAKGASAKTKTKSIETSLDTLLASLHDAKRQLTSGEKSLSDVASFVTGAVEGSKKEIEDRQKEIYNSLNRMGKALDKKFPEPLPDYGPIFTSPEEVAALDRVIALHLLRTGDFEVAETFIEEANVDLNPNHISQFYELRTVTEALRASDLDPALQWCETHQDFLRRRNSSLEFNLHRSRYMRILMSSNDPTPALSYARRHFPPLFPSHAPQVSRLTSALAFLPPPRLVTSPYADLTDDSIHTDLESQFSQEYCALLKMSKQLPLRVVADLGANGALAKIERAKKIMQEKKTEWTAADEIPVEIDVPPEARYHSIFTCPVSKEQTTEMNPPMMLTCGHVLAKDSIAKLAKSGQRVKCPYCPVESTAPAQRVFF